MMTTRGRTRVAAVAAHLVIGIIAVATAGCSRSNDTPERREVAGGAAPLPAAASCPFPFGNTTVIELAEVKGTCTAITTGADKFETIYTTWNDMAFWIVCNRCKKPVDIRLRQWSAAPSTDFVYTMPMWNAANEIELTNVGTHPALGGEIRGQLTSGAGSVSRDYAVGWRLTGDLAWTDIEPRLEIEDDHVALWNRLIKEFVARGPGRAR